MMVIAQALALTDRVRAGARQISTVLDGDTAILGLDSGMYFGLDGVGSRVWELLQSEITVAEIRDALLEQYDVSPGQCESDLVALLEEMLERGLIEHFASEDGTDRIFASASRGERMG